MSLEQEWFDLLRDAGLPLSRRRFVELMGASLALAGCGGGQQGAVPAATDHRDHRLGPVVHFATHQLVDGFAVGARARCRDGRPLLLTGDPLHPASRGGCGVQLQAELLALYDPRRPQAPRLDGQPASWRRLREDLGRDRGRGEGLHLALEPQSGPTVLALLARLRERYPDLVVHDLAPPWAAAGVVASRALTGRALVPVPRLERARVIGVFDADPFTRGPWAARAARDFAASRRRPGARSRLHVVEATPSPAATQADHRLAASAARCGDLLRLLVAELVRRLGAAAITGLSADAVVADEAERRWIGRLAADLAAAGDGALVVVGERQGPAAQALAAVANELLGAVGSTLEWVPDPRAPLPAAGHRSLARALAAGAVEELFVVGGNPVYAAPGGSELERLIASAPRSWYLGDERDETAQACGRFLPRRHLLEGWSDGRALDGTWSIRQATVTPLRPGTDPLELLAVLVGEPRSAVDLVHAQLRAAGVDDLDAAVQLGHLAESAAAPVAPSIDRDGLAGLLAAEPPVRPPPLQLELDLDHRLHDGRYAGNPWLQELPAPATGLCWGNAAVIAPALARARGLHDGDVVELAWDGGRLRVPVLVMPGTAAGSVSLALGYGRRVGVLEPFTVGVDAWPALPPDRPWRPVDLHVSDEHRPLARTQEQFDQADRPIVLEAGLAALRRGESPARHHSGHTHTQRDAVVHGGLQWGMTIDLDACIGCGACVIACQGENNVPVVGRELVRRSLEMHWLRIDRYYRADGIDGAVVWPMPMACQHCERAPCEYVCPVGATTHSPDGLNEMTYNRCVGTRFCANNCPYKVRRFNFYEYNDSPPASRALANNPQVSVRARGVMEKCTYCVQRIREAQQQAATSGEDFDSHVVHTACEEVCPTRAIAFGDINDPTSRVRSGRDGPRAYEVLHQFGTAPRTRYLLRVRDPAEDPG